MKWMVDSGHGWLAVPTVRLWESQVWDKVSEYSYVSTNGMTAYLEEDLDAGLFLTAIGWDGTAISENYRDGMRQDIRGLPSYSVEWMESNKAFFGQLSVK